MARKPYPHAEIERAAQEKWEALSLHVTDLNAPDPYYALTEFPYPSGDLHTGHWYAFAVTDIFARFKRAQGKNVLFPIGFDAFGLPAENAAIKNKIDPAAWTQANIERMRSQLRSMGASFDWSKEVATCSPDYYRWTQWLFIKLYEKGLAYRAEASVKWCPKDHTVLANEQVIDGRCERCGTEVVERKLTQWFLKITEYAERLLQDLDALPWKEEIKEAQRAWIGRLEGARIKFPLSTGKDIEVFTTRPDTIYGATYVVVAPEHPLLSELLSSVSNAPEVSAYREVAGRKTERERSENKDKSGVEFKGVTATNPATKEEIPIYIADYVLSSYGTGAVMAVPAHDERDFEFATKYALPIRCVIDPKLGSPQKNPQEKQKIVAIVEHEGKVLTIKWKPELGGRLTIGGTAEPDEDIAATAMREIAEETGYTDLELIETSDEQVHYEYFAHSKGKAWVAHTTLLHFRLKSDAWQEPALEEDEKGKFEVEWLSVDQAMQEVKDPLHSYALARFFCRKPYEGDGLLRNSGPFDGRGNREALWEITKAVDGVRETGYRLRDWGVSRQRYWGCPIPIVYDPNGNAHAVPEDQLPWLLPADVDFTPTGDASPLASSKELKERVEERFGKGWTPEFDTLDTFVDSSWYFMRYLAPKNTDSFSDLELMRKWLPVDRYSGGSEHTTMHLLYSRFFYKALYDLGLVPTSEPFSERFNRGLILGPDGQKMSKSKGNIINPDESVKEFGADTVRMYLAFIGPYNEPGHFPWKPEGLAATRRFLDRVYKLFERVSDIEASESERRSFAKAAAKIADGLERFKTNTAVSGLMVLMNSLEEQEIVSKDGFRSLLVLIAPFAPHLAEHLHEQSGGSGSVHQMRWPEFDSSLLVEDTVVIGVQVAGKLRGEIEIAPDASEEEAVSAALALPKVVEALGNPKPGKVVYKPARILNLLP